MNCKKQGRVIETEKGLLILSSADSIEFRADCKGKVSVCLYAEREDADCYFTGYIDDCRIEERFHISGGRSELTLSDNIKGTHSFKLVRQTEWGQGDIYITDILAEGEMLDPPKDRELFIEFIGDSLTTGFGNLPNEKSDIAWGGAPIYQDATQTYAYMAAEELSADLSVVAIQGIGTACGGWDFTMNEIYEKYPRVNENDYKYTPKRKADIVVILILGNDKDYYKERGMTLDDVFLKAAELCRMARAKHPGCKVIFSPADYLYEGKEMVEKQLGGAENDYYYTVLRMDCLGKGGHPSVEGHIKAKNTLVPMIRELIGKEKQK